MTEKKKTFLHNRKGNGQIEFVTYQNGKRIYKSTGIKVSPCEWDCVNQIAIGPNAGLINQRLNHFLQRHHERADRINLDKIDLVDWLTEQIDESKHKPGYMKQQRSMVEAIKRFGCMRYLSDVSNIALARWDNWLRHEDPKIDPVKPRSNLTIHNNYHKNLRSYLQKAVFLGLLPENPYLRFKYPRGKSEERTPLTRVQYYAILNLQVPVTKQRAYDLFVFQLLTGMSYSDTQNFNWQNLSNGWYTSRRIKTGMRFHAPVNARAQAILDKWHGAPGMCLEPYNRELKEIAKMVGIRMKLTSHIARHTFITHALEEGIAPNVVQRMVGHSSLIMTERYTHLSDDYIEDGAAALLK